ncbi:hypothetical protein D3C74_436970 [compost metagenome]
MRVLVVEVFAGQIRDEVQFFRLKPCLLKKLSPCGFLKGLSEFHRTAKRSPVQAIRPLLQQYLSFRISDDDAYANHNDWSGTD